MRFFKRKDPHHLRRKQIHWLKKQMQGVKNEIEFVEILTQFWPLPNMAQKMDRLEDRLNSLQAQYAQFDVATDAAKAS